MVDFLAVMIGTVADVWEANAPKRQWVRVFLTKGKITEASQDSASNIWDSL